MNDIDEKKISYTLFVPETFRELVKKESWERNLKENKFIQMAVEFYVDRRKSDIK